MKHPTQPDTDVCDPCGREMRANAPDFEHQERLAIRFRAGSDSVFGDGSLVESDLCQHCVKEVLGPWLRVTPDDPREPRHRLDWAPRRAHQEYQRPGTGGEIGPEGPQRPDWPHDEDLIWWIEHRLDELANLEATGTAAELENIRANAPKGIPGPHMRTLWRLMLTGRVKSALRAYDLYRWRGRFTRDALTATLRLELREMLTPRVSLREPFSCVWRRRMLSHSLIDPPRPAATTGIP